MNPYQVMGIIASCTLVFAGVVTLLTMQGVPLLLAFLGVYLVAVCCMLGMQKRARQTYDGMRYMNQRRHDDGLSNADNAGDSDLSGKAVSSDAQYLSLIHISEPTRPY